MLDRLLTLLSSILFAGGIAYAASTVPIGSLTDTYNNGGTTYCSICLTVSGNAYTGGNQGTRLLYLNQNNSEVFGISPAGNFYAGNGNDISWYFAPAGNPANYQQVIAVTNAHAKFGSPYISFGSPGNPGINNVHLTGSSIGSVSSCGTSPTTAANSSDFAGSVTTGAAASGCTIAFSSTKSAPSFCAVSDQSRAITYSVSTTAIVVSGASAGDIVNWICSDTGSGP